MSNTTLKIQPSQLVSLNNSEVTTTSLIIAETFGKQHCHVLRDIEALECSDEFRLSNFGLSEKSTACGFNVRKSKYYSLTKDGFMFLAMGFTGKKAAQWKEAFINAFNQLSKQATLPDPQDIPTPINGNYWKLRTYNPEARYLLDKGIKSLVTTLKRSGRPATYNSVWKLVHLKSGMTSVKNATPEQVERAIAFVSEVLAAELLTTTGDPAHHVAGAGNMVVPTVTTPPQPTQDHSQLIALLNFTVGKFEHIELMEKTLNQVASVVQDLKQQVASARYQTTDLKIHLSQSALELQKAQQSTI